MMVLEGEQGVRIQWMLSSCEACGGQFIQVRQWSSISEESGMLCPRQDHLRTEKNSLLFQVVD